MLITSSKIYAYGAVLLCVFALLLLASPVAHADGGAPNLAYVAGTSQGVSVIDVAQRKITGSLSATGDPHTILLSGDARFLYITEPQAGKVVVKAAKTGQLICMATLPGQPTLLALAPDFATLYAAGNGASSVSALDPTNCTIKHTFHANEPVYGMGIAVAGSSASGGEQLWVAGTNALTIFSTTSGQQMGTVPIPEGPQYISIPAGAMVYVTTRQGRVLGVDLNKHELITLIRGGKYGPMDYDAITGEIYVPDLQNKQLIVLTPATAGFPPPHEPERVIKLDVQPASVAITSDGQLGFVALSGGTVAMLDIPGRQLITILPVGGNPHFIITGLYPPVLGTTPQQATVLNPVLLFAAYIMVIVLLIAPILFFRRYIKRRVSME